mgnify:CR=1 FL=1
MRGLLSLMLAIPLVVGCGDASKDDDDDDWTSNGDTASDFDGGWAGDFDDGGADDGGADDGGADDGGADDSGSDDGGFDADGGPVGLDEDGDGVTLEDGDCDNTDATIYPFAGDTYGDGVDSDCDGLDCEAGYSGDTYFVTCIESINYNDANDGCISAGHDSLAAIIDDTEQEFVVSLLTMEGFSEKDFWIGLNDKDSEGTWRLEDGTLAPYLNWAPGEPNLGEHENCAAIDIPSYAGGWLDAPCENPRKGFVCETRPPTAAVDEG